MMKKVIFSGIIITCLFQLPVYAAHPERIVEEGNKLYKSQKYDQASKLYEQARLSQPDSAILNFNSGTAEFKLKEYQKAISSFEKSLLSQNKAIEAKANYNLANSKYMLGLSTGEADTSGALGFLEGALDNYKRAIELAPQDTDAKANYELTQKKVKELREKLKEENLQNKDARPEEKQDKSQSQKQGENSPSQTPEDEKQAEKQQGQLSQAQEQKEPGASEFQQGKKEDEKEPGKNAQAKQEDIKEMSKEEAEMILEGYRQEENNSGMLKDDRRGQEERVLKDW